jgi:hypothetical protein
LGSKAYNQPSYILSHEEIKALKKYLITYKLRKVKKMQWKEIFLKDLTLEALKQYNEGPRQVQKAMYEEGRLLIMRDCRKGSKIMKNVVNGDFPGNYQ